MGYPTIKCRVEPKVRGEFGCQLCWASKDKPTEQKTRQDCIKINTVNKQTTHKKKSKK